MSGWIAIVNPHSGGRRHDSRSLADAIEEVRKVADETVVTKYRGHARCIAAAAREYCGVICVGGDGTLHEVLNGIDRRRQSVGIVPTGRGNSLARDLGTWPIGCAIEALQAGQRCAIDVAEVTMSGASGARTRVRSASTVALGYPAATTILANRMRGLGRFCYAAAGVAAAIGMKPLTIGIAYEGGGRSERRLTGLLINNTRHVANFVAFPQAECADGRFEVMELNAGFAAQNLHNLSALSSRNFYSPARMSRAACVTVNLPYPAEVMVDGEIYRGVIALDVRVRARALECIRGRSEHQ